MRVSNVVSPGLSPAADKSQPGKAQTPNSTASADSSIPSALNQISQPLSRSSSTLSFADSAIDLSADDAASESGQQATTGNSSSSSAMSQQLMSMMEQMLSMMISMTSGQGASQAQQPEQLQLPASSRQSGGQSTGQVAGQGSGEASNDSDAGQSAAADNGQMSFQEVVSTLGRHEGLLKKAHDREGLEKIRDDESTPTDEKQALDTLLNNQDMFDSLDQAKKGKTDGKISAEDVQKWQNDPQMKAYAEAKSEDYTHNYVPSDAAPGSAPREMSGNDAMRELYLYSESLPKNIGPDTLENIANGSQNMDKAPPQVAAAAKYFTDHPDEWQQLVGNDKGKTSRNKLCDKAAANVQLSPQENQALQTVKNNEDIFFKKGGIKPDKLADIANDTNNSQDVRDAANLLAQPNSMLFSMLDNGKHGAGGNLFNYANDKNISKGDIDAFIRKGSNTVAQPDKLAAPATTLDELSAQEDMSVGQQTQPDEKKKQGGGFFKFLDIFTNVLSGLAVLIPGVGEAALAGNAARAAVTAGVKEGIKQGAKEGVKEGVKEGGKQALENATASQQQATGNPDVEAPRVWAQS